MTTAAALDAAALPGDIRFMNATADLLLRLGSAGIVALGAVWLAQQPVFALDDIRIEGEVTHNSASTIRASAVPQLAGTFFTLDLGAARRAFENVPWVRSAELRRVWPNRLAVRLEEHRPAALWGGGGDDDDADRLVDDEGEVFEANLGDVEDENLPLLKGPDGSAPQMLRLWGRLKPALLPLRAAPVALELSGRGSWRVDLANGAAIELGRGSEGELVARLDRFVGTYAQVTARFQRPFEYADLRHNEGYAVRLRGVTTTPEIVVKPAKK